MPLEPEEKAEFIDLITKNSDLLLKLINDILDLSRIESGSMSFSYENLDRIQRRTYLMAHIRQKD